MCSEWVECTMYTKCGHLVVTKNRGFLDCKSRRCERSYLHLDWCERTDCIKEYQHIPRTPKYTLDTWCEPCRKRLTVLAKDLPSPLPKFNYR